MVCDIGLAATDPSSLTPVAEMGTNCRADDDSGGRVNPDDDVGEEFNEVADDKSAKFEINDDLFKFEALATVPPKLPSPLNVRADASVPPTWLCGCWCPGVDARALTTAAESFGSCC